MRTRCAVGFWKHPRGYSVCRGRAKSCPVWLFWGALWIGRKVRPLSYSAAFIINGICVISDSSGWKSTLCSNKLFMIISHYLALAFACFRLIALAFCRFALGRRKQTRVFNQLPAMLLHLLFTQGSLVDVLDELQRAPVDAVALRREGGKRRPGLLVISWVSISAHKDLVWAHLIPFRFFWDLNFSLWRGGRQSDGQQIINRHIHKVFGGSWDIADRLYVVIFLEL